MDVLYVRILLVDQTNRFVRVRDRANGEYLANFQTLSPAFRIPQVGEVWSIFRVGTQWHLRAFVDDSPRFTAELERLSPGDTILTSDGAISLVAPDGLQLNGEIVGAHHEETHTSNGGGSYTLRVIPDPTESLIVHYGVDRLNSTTDYTISGRVVTLIHDYATGMPVTFNYEHSSRLYKDSASVYMRLFPSGTD